MTPEEKLRYSIEHVFRSQNTFCHFSRGTFDDFWLINFRVEHQRMHEKHKGHDAMHAEMVIILLVTLVVAQVALVEWKKRHYRSYSVSWTDGTSCDFRKHQ